MGSSSVIMQEIWILRAETAENNPSKKRKQKRERETKEKRRQEGRAFIDWLQSLNLP